MKKALIAIIFALLLTGCTVDESYIQSSPTIESVSMEYSDFNLIADKKTDIVYIDNVVYSYEGSIGHKRIHHVYTPYYGKHGRPCKFIDGKVVELE